MMRSGALRRIEVGCFRIYDEENDVAQMNFLCATEVRDQFLILRGQRYMDDTGGKDLKQCILSASYTRIKGLVVGITKCIHVNSSKISCFVDLAIFLGHQKQIEVRLCGLSSLLEEAFRMVGLAKLVRVFSGIDDAVRELFE